MAAATRVEKAHMITAMTSDAEVKLNIASIKSMGDIEIVRNLVMDLVHNFIEAKKQEASETGEVFDEALYRKEIEDLTHKRDENVKKALDYIRHTNAMDNLRGIIDKIEKRGSTHFRGITVESAREDIAKLQVLRDRLLTNETR